MKISTGSKNFSLLRELLFGGVAVLAMIAGSTGLAAAQVVSTPNGTFPAATYSGTSANGVSVFRGIRFAASPTGNLRWAPPAPPAAVSGTIDATSFGPACPQLASPFGVASTNEDCLFLNVYVPGSVSSRNHLPVMVFYYGGAFVSGAGSLYNPSQMATQGHTIVVTVNYRLGELGYMASPALSAQASNGVSGNYGLLDQQFALKWVRQNISAFGGNSNNVSIFGESAGGFSVCSLLVAPSAHGLFDRAITESGPCGFPLPTLATSETSGAAFTASVGCDLGSSADTVACLRGLSTQEILDHQPSAAALLSNPNALTAFFPNVDGKIIPQQPELAIALGQFNKVPVIEGTNQSEGNLFIALAFDLLRGAPLTAAEYPAQVQAGAQAIVDGVASTLGTSSSSSTVAKLTQEILNEYPLSDFNSPDQALAQVLTDGTFSCPALVSDELLSIYTPTFAYEFADANAPMLFLPPVSFPYGATHTDELQFLFDNLGGFPSLLNNDETKLATTMKGYWTNFAKHGSPNSFGSPFWSPFAILSPNVESLVPPNPKASFNFSGEHHCNFWSAILVQGTVSSILSANGG